MKIENGYNIPDFVRAWDHSCLKKDAKNKKKKTAHQVVSDPLWYGLKPVEITLYFSRGRTPALMFTFFKCAFQRHPAALAIHTGGAAVVGWFVVCGSRGIALKPKGTIGLLGGESDVKLQFLSRYNDTGSRNFQSDSKLTVL